MHDSAPKVPSSVNRATTVPKRAVRTWKGQELYQPIRDEASRIPWIVELCCLFAPDVVIVSIRGNWVLKVVNPSTPPALALLYPNIMTLKQASVQIIVRSLEPAIPMKRFMLLALDSGA